ncbi:hypothetical protein OQA88_425 [Cercophora sp. LCS_1]
MESPRSPKRRKILASINPLETRVNSDDDDGYRPRHPHQREKLRAAPPRDNSPEDPAPARSPKEAQEHVPPETAPKEDTSDPSLHHRASKFRFKSSKSHRSSRHKDDQRSHSPSTHRHHRRHRSRSPRRRRHGINSCRSPSPFTNPPLDPDAAFRESLFDAMADDEGAAYWESVYGQPIHVYSSAREHVGPQGELERMTDEEYAAFVRQKMWEKTHAGLVEERERRAKEREERSKKDAERERIQREMERSLKRGEERRRKRVWSDKWRAYLDGWKVWNGEVGGIPWPGGKGNEEVREFFVRGLGLEEVGEQEFLKVLKEERVRWHPDKMMQRMGGSGEVDADVIKEVTAVFQTIDSLWNDTKKTAG